LCVREKGRVFIGRERERPMAVGFKAVREFSREREKRKEKKGKEKIKNKNNILIV